MSKNAGTRVITPLVPYDSADTNPTHEDKYGKGGYVCVATLVERDAIPSARRKPGMLVYVIETNLTYRCDPSLVSFSEPPFLTTAGNQTLTGDLSIDGNLDVTGDTTLHGALAHDGTTVGFFGATPIAQQAQTVDLKSLLVLLGFYDDTADDTPLDLGAGGLQAGAAAFSGVVSLALDPVSALQAATKRYVDAAVANTLIPAGMMAPFAGSVAPTGWLMCDGAAVSRTTYATLFTAIGTTYGAGDGSLTFNMPDLRGRAPVGAGQGNTAEGGGTGTARVAGQKIGAEKHTLTESEMPSHTHSLVLSPNGSGGGGTGNFVEGGTHVAGRIDNTGGGQPHTIVGPGLVTNFIVKT